MDEKLREELDRIQAINLTMQAEIMALTAFVAKQAENPESAFDEIRKETRRRHGALLLLLENKDPELAARLDKRPPQNID